MSLNCQFINPLIFRLMKKIITLLYTQIQLYASYFIIQISPQMKECEKIYQDDYLKVSSTSLEFGSSQELIRSLILKNTHESNAIIYKIKTNNLQALQATPNFGFIRATTAISLRIKTISSPFDAKLLISYAIAGERPGQFNEVWTSLPKNQVKNKQVRVWRTDENQYSKSNKQVEIKSTSSINNHAQRSYSQQRINKNFLPKNSADMMQNELASNIFDLQQKLSDQQISNAKLKQQLQITEDKLKEINQERLQIKVNKSIGIICEDYHTSFTTLLLYGLAVFVFGYILAKWEN